MEEQLKSLFANILNIEKNKIKNDLKIGDIASWDSLGHLNLITGIEEEFNIFFSNDEILELNSFEKFHDLLITKI